MATDWEAIDQALRSWLLTSSALAGNKVIFAQPNAPRPVPGPFITINTRLAVARRGVYDEERFNAGVATRVGHRRLTASINVYGPGARALGEACADGLERYDVRDALSAVGLAVIDPGQVRDLTSLLQTTNEERSQFDAVFALVLSNTESVGWIQTVEGDGTYSGSPPSGTATQGFTFTTS